MSSTSFLNSWWKTTKNLSFGKKAKFKFNNNNNHNNNFNNFNRKIHTSTKRPNFNSIHSTRASKYNSWSVYDELKLFSYSSHFAFFLLLPPVIQLYTTKVEVVRDETLTESPFTNNSKDDETKNFEFRNFKALGGNNIIDILQLEKKNLLPNEKKSIDANIDLKDSKNIENDNQFKDRLPSTPEELIGYLNNNNNKKRNLRHNNQNYYYYKDNKTNNHISYNDSNNHYLSISELIKLFELVTEKKISEKEYIKEINLRVINLIKIKRSYNNLKSINEIFKILFGQLHRLKLYKLENEFFGKLIMMNGKEHLKFLNAREKLIKEYEFSKSTIVKTKSKNGNKNKINKSLKFRDLISTRKDNKHESNSHSMIDKMMISSDWLWNYLEKFECFQQILDMFIMDIKSRDAYSILFFIGLRSKDVKNKLQDKDVVVNLLNKLLESGKTREMKMLIPKLEKLNVRNFQVKEYIKTFQEKL